MLLFAVRASMAPKGLPTLHEARRRFGSGAGESSATPQSPALGAVGMAAAAAAAAGSILRRVGNTEEVRSGSGGAAAAKSGGRAASPVRFSALESDGEESDEDFEAEYCETRLSRNT